MKVFCIKYLNNVLKQCSDLKLKVAQFLFQEKNTFWSHVLKIEYNYSSLKLSLIHALFN